jgi:hypothetical protein
MFTASTSRTYNRDRDMYQPMNPHEQNTTTGKRQK